MDDVGWCWCEKLVVLKVVDEIQFSDFDDSSSHPVTLAGNVSDRAAGVTLGH